jgi:hypothetical protein
MSRRRLSWLLRARGTDLLAWPEAERRAALALLRRNRAARQDLADAITGEDAPESDPAALARMQHGLHRALRPRPVLRSIGWSALVACAAAGLYLGTGVTETDNAADPDLFTPAQTITLAALDQ